MQTAYRSAIPTRTIGRFKEALAASSADLKGASKGEPHLLPLVLIGCPTCHLLPELHATARVHTDLAL